MIDRSPIKAFSSLCIPIIILLAALVFAACDSSDQGSAQDDDSDIDDDAQVDDDDDNGNDDDDDDDDTYNVLEREDIGAQWPCHEPISCVDEYLNFPNVAAEYADPITPDQLEYQLDNLGEPITTPIPEDQMADLLVELMNIEFLRQGINPRQLVASTIYRNETPEYKERLVLLSDEYVGTFQTILLEPQGKGPFPGVIAYTGHGEDCGTYRDYFFGEDYPAHGYAILMICPRVNGADENEDLVTRTLLLDGFTFMGVRNYEVLLALKYLRFLDSVDNDRIGLIGHCGGAVGNNLTIRTEDGFNAYIYDSTGGYYNGRWEGGEFWLLDETVPAIYPYNQLINDFDGFSIPTFHLGSYTYPEAEQDIFNFFDQHIK